MKQSKSSIKSNTPRLIGTKGELSTTFDFNGQEVSGSCGVTYHNTHFIYGGKVNKQQILQLKDCGLINVGLLEFNHHVGACASTNEAIILCFDNNTKKRCRQASTLNGPWRDMTLSTYEHQQTSIATSPGNWSSF